MLPQNIVITPSSTVTSQNIVTTSQNAIVTLLNVEESTANIIKTAMDIAQVEPTPQTFIKIGNEIFQSVSQVQKQQVIKQHVSKQQPVEESIMPTESFTIPEGFRKTKFENTLEKIDPVCEKDQKAGKRFFCQLCMMNKIETGYTKRFDLTKHLTRCGKEGVEKPFKCTGYGACEKSFARVENLRQHVASEHTKETLYKCKRCGKGFSRSSDASNHRRSCYQKDEEEDEPDKEEKREQPNDD